MSFRYVYIFIAIISLALAMHLSSATLGMVAGQPHVNVPIGSSTSVNVTLLNTGSIPVSFKVVLPIFKSKNNTIPNITVSPMAATIAPKTDIIVNITLHVSKKNNIVGDSWVGILQFIEVLNVTNPSGAVVHSGLAKILTVTAIKPIFKPFSLLSVIKRTILDIIKIPISLFVLPVFSSVLIVSLMVGMASNITKVFIVTTITSPSNISYLTVGILMIIVTIFITIPLYINRRKKASKEAAEKRRIARMQTRRRGRGVKPLKRRKTTARKTTQKKAIKKPISRRTPPRKTSPTRRGTTPRRSKKTTKYKRIVKPFTPSKTKKHTSSRKGRNRQK